MRPKALSKHCRPRSDAAERGVWSGSAVFSTFSRFQVQQKLIRWTFQGLGSGPSCSKLTMSLVNDSLKFTSIHYTISHLLTLQTPSKYCSRRHLIIQNISKEACPVISRESSTNDHAKHNRTALPEEKKKQTKQKKKKKKHITNWHLLQLWPAPQGLNWKWEIEG